MKPLAILLLTAALGLSAQDSPDGERLGIGLYALTPISNLGTDFGAGFQGGIQIHFNRESRHLGRLRIDYLRMDSKHAILTDLYGYWNGITWVSTPQYANSRMEAYSVAYEWMPHLEGHSHSGLFGIFGMGGTLWNETRRPTPSPNFGSYTVTDLGFTLSAGVGWRFNTHAAVEARFVNSDISFRQHPNYGSDRAFLTFGTSLRF